MQMIEETPPEKLWDLVNFTLQKKSSEKNLNLKSNLTLQYRLILLWKWLKKRLQKEG